MTTLALQMMGEIRSEVQAKLLEISVKEESQIAPAGSKYVETFTVGQTRNMPDLAIANCPHFVVPRHFIFPG